MHEAIFEKAGLAGKKDDRKIGSVGECESGPVAKGKAPVIRARIPESSAPVEQQTKHQACTVAGYVGGVIPRACGEHDQDDRIAKGCVGDTGGGETDQPAHFTRQG